MTTKWDIVGSTCEAKGSSEIHASSSSMTARLRGCRTCRNWTDFCLPSEFLSPAKADEITHRRHECLQQALTNGRNGEQYGEPMASVMFGIKSDAALSLPAFRPVVLVMHTDECAHLHYFVSKGPWRRSEHALSEKHSAEAVSVKR